MQYILVLIVIVVLFMMFKPKAKKMDELSGHWVHSFPNLQFSTQEFYSLVANKVKVLAMPDVRFFTIFNSESGVLSNKREYLRIERKGDLFDVCAAPFGTGFFVSFWFGNPAHGFRNWLIGIPIIGPIIENWNGATYYVVDTSCMFRGSVTDCIKEAIEEITTSKGVRGLSEMEQMAMNK